MEVRLQQLTGEAAEVLRGVMNDKAQQGLPGVATSSGLCGEDDRGGGPRVPRRLEQGTSS